MQSKPPAMVRPTIIDSFLQWQEIIIFRLFDFVLFCFVLFC